MSIRSALRKLKRLNSLAIDSASQLVLWQLFFRRYNYPGSAILRQFWPRCQADPTLKLKLPGAQRSVLLTLRMDDRGDIASLFENFIEQDLRSLWPEQVRCALDLGAHIGTYTVALASYFPAIRVIAVEPLKANVAVLERNVQLNGLDVTIVEAAVCCASGMVHFSSEASNAGHVAEDGELVRSMTITELITSRAEELDLVKVDIEGAEISILPDLLKMIRRDTIVHVELHHAERNRREFLNIVSQANRRGKRVDCYPPHEGWIIS